MTSPIMETVGYKPCPFCGASDVLLSTNPEGVQMIKCRHCFVFQYKDKWEVRPSEQKLKDAIQKMLNGIDFALDEAFSRKTVSARLRECRSEAIKFLVAKTK